MKNSSLIIVLVLMVFFGLCFAKACHGQMTVESFTLKATGDKIQFLKYLPSGYDKTKKYPVLVSLSGDGEKAGSGIAALQGSGINRCLINGTISLPFIVVSPQTPYANYDIIGNQGLNLPGVFATEMLDTAIARYNGDPTKTYITGLSMGGPSVPNAMAAFPTKWAAGISMASWETDLNLAKLITGPIWDIKLDGDPTAGPPDYNINFVSNLPNKSSRYTAMQGSGHWIWDQVYADAWESMTVSPNYPGSTKPSNVYTWLSQFTTSGIVPITPVPITPSPVVVVVPSPVISSGKQVPGLIEAEAFDKSNNIAVEPCSDSAFGKDVGYIRDASWMDYNVNVSTTGNYNLSIRYSSTSAGILQVRNTAGVPLDTIAVPVTGGWQKWATIVKPITLATGIQTLRVYVQKAGFNLNWFNFQLAIPTIAIPCSSTVLITNPQGVEITINGKKYTSDLLLNVK